MANVKKIYEIQIIGEQQVIEKMNKVNAALDKARASIKLMKGDSQKGTLDTAQLDKERQKLVDLQTEAKKLQSELRALNNFKLQTKISDEADKNRVQEIQQQQRREKSIDDFNKREESVQSRREKLVAKARLDEIKLQQEREKSIDNFAKKEEAASRRMQAERITELKLQQQREKSVDNLNRKEEAAEFKRQAAESKRQSDAEKLRISEIRLQQQREKSIDDFNRKEDAAINKKFAAAERAALMEARQNQRREKEAEIMARREASAAASAAKAAAALEKQNAPYQSLINQLNQLKVAAQNVGVEKGIFSKEFAKAATEASNMAQQVEKVDQALTKQHSRLSNKKEGLFGLNNSIAQVMREMPNFAIDPRIGIMSLTNNLPYLGEAIAEVNKQVKVQKAEFQAWAVNAKKAAIETSLKAGMDQKAALAAGAHAEAQVMLNYQASKSPSVFKQIFSSVFGWQTIMIVAITLLMQFSKEIIEWTRNVFKSKKPLDQAAEGVKHLSEALKATEFKKAVRDVSEMTTAFALARDGILSKDKALKFYNETLGKVMGTVNSLDEAEQKMAKHADNYIKATLYKAAANLALDKSAEAMLKAEEARMKKLKDFENRFEDAPNGSIRSEDDYKKYVQRTAQAQAKRRKEAIEESERDAKSQEDIAKRMMATAAKYAKDLNFDSLYGKDEKEKKPKKYKGAQLTGEQKDFLSDILAAKDLELAKLKEKQQKGLVTEEQYWETYKNIVVKYRNQILAYLDGSNAKERRITAQQRRRAIDEVARANDELYDFYKKGIDLEYKNLNKIAENQKNAIVDNIYSTAEEKNIAEDKFTQDSYNNQVIYTQKMLDLNIEYHKSTIEATDLLLTELERKMQETNLSNLTTAIKTLKNQIEDVAQGKEMIVNQNEINAAVERSLILNDKKLNQEQKLLDLEEVSQRLEINNNNAELGNVIADITLYDIQISKRKLNNEELRNYNNLLRERAILEGKKIELEKQAQWSGYKPGMPSSGGLQGMIGSAFKTEGRLSIGKDKKGKDVDGSELLGEVIAQSFDLASLAMNNYFDAEKSRIEKSKALAYEKIDIETAQMKRRSQSAAENESLDRQAAEKKKTADKEAGERLKKVKKQELKMALAMQLANIGVAAAQNPLNGVTFGAAGIAMYSILAAIALAQYAVNASAINKTTYARGGKLPTKGGRFIGESHANGGIQVGMNEFEGDELAIINKRSAKSNDVLSVTGTPNQIASKINAFGGGVDWAGGATLKQFAQGGSYIGSNLQPPVFRSYFSSPSATSDFNSERMDRIENSIENLAEITRMESAKKVVVSNKDIFGQRDEYVKQTKIATL